jgi:hypothetical protein
MLFLLAVFLFGGLCWVTLALLLPLAMKQPRLLWLAVPVTVPALLIAVLAVRLILVELRPVKPLPLAGRYELRYGRESGVLTLVEPSTYRFCRGDGSCETGRYSLEPFDVRYGFGRLGFSGAEMRALTGGGIVNIDYQGWACPCMSFMDPDDGYQFIKAAE